MNVVLGQPHLNSLTFLKVFQILYKHFQIISILNTFMYFYQLNMVTKSEILFLIIFVCEDENIE